MSEEETPRLERAARKAGLSDEQAQAFAGAIAKELERERKKMNDEVKALRNEMEKMELRLIIKLGGLIVVAVGVLAAIMKL